MNTNPKPLLALRAAMLALAILLAHTVCDTGLANAQSLILSNLVLDNQAGDVTVRFGLEVDNLEPLLRDLKDGSSLGLLCRAKLSRHRSYWTDQVVAQNDLQQILTWDGLTREFILSQPGQEDIRSNSLSGLVKTAWSEMSLDLGQWDVLKRGREYVLDLDVGMSRFDVPAWLRKTLFFWSWDVVQEAHYRLEFKY